LEDFEKHIAEALLTDYVNPAPAQTAKKEG